MSDSIGSEDVLRLAKLARISVDENSFPKMVQDLKGMIDFLDKIHVSEFKSEVPNFVRNFDLGVLREDVAGPSSTQKEILSGAIRSEDGFFVI
jgi:aspartyl/glutamyl-tRNA(Asn/Gln) amidotransferase C subunit